MSVMSATAAATLPWVVAIISVQWPTEVSAHGMLTVPASRNVIDGNAGCAHCLNSAGPCGDGGSGKFANFFAGPQATWSAGSIVPITIRVTAHHRGHYEFRICDQVIKGGMSNPEACLNKWVLERATPEEAGFTDCEPGDDRPACVPYDPKHPERWYLPPSTEISGTHTIYFKVPAGLQCEVCTMQWHWWSANSCVPAGDYGCYKDILRSKGYWVGSKAAWWTAGSGSCSGPAGPNGHFGCGEQFWNCADIKITAASGPTPMPMPVPMPAPVPMPTSTMAPSPAPSTPTPPPTAMPAPSPTPEPTMSSCQSCSVMHSSPCIWTDSKCYPISKELCMSTEGALWCGGAVSATTTTTTRTASAGESCQLRFAESASFGASPEVCQETCGMLPVGIWPCSSDGPCDCPSAAMLLTKSRRTQLRGHVSKHLMAGVGFIQEIAVGAKKGTDMHEENGNMDVAETCNQ